MRLASLRFAAWLHLLESLTNVIILKLVALVLASLTSCHCQDADERKSLRRPELPRRWEQCIHIPSIEVRNLTVYFAFMYC